MVPAWFWLPRPDGHNVTKAGEVLVDNPPSKPWMRLLALSYFCAGVGYVISATFLVVIVERQPALQGYGLWVWLTVGLTAAPACFIWDRIARRTGELQAMLLAFALQIVGIVLPALDVSATLVLLSAALYGGTFIGIVSLMLVYVVPKVVGVFANTNQELPALTTGLIALSDFLRDYGLFLAAAIGIGIWLLTRLLKNPRGHSLSYGSAMYSVPTAVSCRSFKSK